MLLRWEIDNPAWPFESRVLCDEHTPNSNLIVFACILVGSKIVGKRLFEHQCDAPSHHTNRVNGIDQRFDSSVEDIPLEEFHHQKYQSSLA
jgi:hypothetical protein